MSENVLPVQSIPRSYAVQNWDDQSPQNAQKPPFERPLAAIRRYKFLIIGIVLAAAGAGVLATRMVTPMYEVQTTIWIESQTPMQTAGGGPIRSAELLNDNAWVELLGTFTIADAVVRKLALYLTPKNTADTPLFTGFTLGDSLVPGTYELLIDKSAKRWTLTHATAQISETGTPTDSIGHRLGFRWMLPATAWDGSGQKKVEFTVSTPRETAVALIHRMNPTHNEHSNFLRVTLTDRDPKLAAQTLNTYAEEYVRVAGELKKRNVVEYAKILDDQLRFAETSLHNAESALEDFRVNTITMPAEGGPVAAGIQDTRDPVMRSFLERRSELDDLKNDIKDLEQTIANAKNGTSRYQAALLISSVATSPGAAALRKAFDDLYATQSKLVAARQVYTDEHPVVKDLLTTVDNLQNEQIPTLANQLLAQLKQRQTEFDSRVAGASKEIKEIPTRTIEEMRLRRQVSIADGLYTTLKASAATANLAAASAHPDVNVLDPAVAPLEPTKKTTLKILGMALAGGIGTAFALALLLDLTDRRIRYPDQATNDLGLVIAGAVPRIPKQGIDSGSPEQLSHLVEAFRSIRMHVAQSGQTPLSLAISSPQPGDGKSLVSANLAMSFAEAGYRTVLIDGDTRRGMLEEMFAIPKSPGLTEYLAGGASLASVVHPTAHDKLSLLPAGSRNPRSPELLASATLATLVNELRTEFDVVIFDTPPFAAGIDAYALAAAAGKLLVVLRVGKTEKRMAAAKLTVVDRLPVEVLGAVLNGVGAEGEYQYYGYAAGYGVAEPEVAGQLT
jgi:succinoglycan biosynthesis transport protein ExoP